MTLAKEGAAASQNGTTESSYPLKVQLGEHTYEVYPQKHAYLNHRLAQWMESLQDVSTDAAEDVDSLHGFLGMVGDNAYELLKVFIPDLMPEYEFRGFATKEAMEAGDYDEQYDRSPPYPDIFDAFETVLRVNRLNSLKKAGGLVDPRVIRAWVTQQVGGFLTRQRSATSSDDATAGLPTTSGTTPPTSEESTG